jgi:hypothetical protein
MTIMPDHLLCWSGMVVVVIRSRHRTTELCQRSCQSLVGRFHVNGRRLNVGLSLACPPRPGAKVGCVLGIVLDPMGQ